MDVDKLSNHVKSRVYTSRTMDLFIALLSLPLLLFIIFKLHRRRRSSLLDLIPGPRKLPIIGNLHLLAGNSNLHHLCRDLSLKYGPLFRLQLGEIPFIIISSAAAAEQVLKTHDHVFANRPDLGFTAKTISYNYTNIGLSPHGDYWRNLRKICSLELLSVKRVRLFRPIREEGNMNLCRWFAEREGAPVNLSERVYTSSFDVTTLAAVGRRSGDGESVSDAFREVTKVALGFTVADLLPSIPLIGVVSGIKMKMGRIFRRADRILEDVINQRRAAMAAAAIDGGERSGEDLVDVLLKCQDDGGEIPLTTDNVKAVLMDMFTAGAETSATVIEWAMSEMIKNPTTLDKAQEEVRKTFDDKGYVEESHFEELKYLRLVIKEAMRLHSPLPLVVPRQNSRRCEINGYEIPAKTNVIINSWALGRDPKYWNDADRFMPERFQDNSIDYKGSNMEYIPFGAGRRICPGMAFGTANVECALAMLLYHFDWSMPDGVKNEELDMTEELGSSVKRKHGLVLIPTVARPLKMDVK